MASMHGHAGRTAPERPMEERRPAATAETSNLANLTKDTKMRTERPGSMDASRSGAASLLAVIWFAPVASAQEPKGASGSDVAETGRKLSNPLSDVWALFTRFDANFADGDVNQGDAKVGGRMLFQPILPVPLHGTGANRWNFIARPTIPVLFSEPVPTGLNRFDHTGGMGDIAAAHCDRAPHRELDPRRRACLSVPNRDRRCLRSQPVGRRSVRWLWATGHPAVTFGAFGQYYFGIGSHGDRAPGVQDASFMNLLYFFSLNLPSAWQIAFDPTITYDARATSGNKWNVPVGLSVAKTTLIGKLPVKFQLGVEYSVVSQDTYGDQGKLVLEVIPVIPALIHRRFWAAATDHRQADLPRTTGLHEEPSITIGDQDEHRTLGDR